MSSLMNVCRFDVGGSLSVFDSIFLSTSLRTKINLERYNALCNSRWLVLSGRSMEHRELVNIRLEFQLYEIKSSKFRSNIRRNGKGLFQALKG